VDFEGFHRLSIDYICDTDARVCLLYVMSNCNALGPFITFCNVPQLDNLMRNYVNDACDPNRLHIIAMVLHEY
jgi:hypothetical protein